LECTTERDITEYDIDKATTIIHDYLGVNASIKMPLELGCRSQTNQNYRKLSSRKISVLKNCTKLRSEDHPTEIQKIFITPDLTPKQQEANKALKAELEKMNKVETHIR